MKIIKFISIVATLVFCACGGKKEQQSTVVETTKQTQTSNSSTISSETTTSTTTKAVIMNFPRELSCFLEDLGVKFDNYCDISDYEYECYCVHGDISYKSKEQIELDSIEMWEDYEGDNPVILTCFPLDKLSEHKYTIKSYSNGGFMLSVNAKKIDNEPHDILANCKLIYKEIVLVHPLQIPHDSVICTNLNFDYSCYGFEQWGFDSRPCAGNVKVYRVDGNEKYLLREIVEASEERTIWKEYYPNGNVKSITTTSNNPQEVDEDGFSAEPYVTNTKYYFEDKQESYQSASYANYQEEDKSSTQWKKFAGNSYRASELINNIWQNYAFSFNNSGHGKYIFFGTLPGSNIVTDQMEFEISNVTSDDDYLYLHCYELNSPIKIKIKGNTLYTANGSERYEKWQ